MARQRSGEVAGDTIPRQALALGSGVGGGVLWDWADLVPVDCGFELLLLTPLTHAG